MNRAAIFDFNGTIFWDTELNYISWRNCIRRWLDREYSREEYFNLNGRTNKETIEKVFNKKLSKEFIVQKDNEKTVEYLKNMKEQQENVKLAPGFEEFAQRLLNQGITIAIATSASPSLMIEYKKVFKLTRFFKEEFIISSDGSLASKPDPAIYLKTINRLDIPASSTIVFEDAKSGIISAYRAKVKKVIAVLSDGSDVDTITNLKETSMIITDYFNLDIDELFN
jgi:HAD superfamily hydrolase (TIGR01509 family)